MLGSLRVRLPLVFLGGILLAGLVTTAIAARLFENYAHQQSLRELRREAEGISQLYSNAVHAAYTQAEKPQAPTFARVNLERTTGDRIYYRGVPPFPGVGASGLRDLPPATKIDWQSGRSLTFEFTPADAKHAYLAVATPLRAEKKGDVVGAIVVAQPKANVRDRVLHLIRRLAIAGALGLLVAVVLAVYLSRRLVRPVLQLSHAADEVARGRYDVQVPQNAAGEIGHLAERFGEMAQRLAEAEALERNFLMSVSHELRTPLTAIRGHVAAMLEGVVDDAELRTHSLEIVEAEAARLERLVGDILDLAKLDAHRFTVMREEVDMEQLLERAYETFTEEARQRSIDYRVELKARPVIVSDGDRVLQIVGNLLSNAFRATPDGGRISLELAQSNGHVRVSVEDTGPGIAPEKRERLFRPFVSEGAGGTGLGLAIAKELSQALGGRIDLESEVGRGSRFDLVLPAR
jgi:histidine kinase